MLVIAVRAEAQPRGVAGCHVDPDDPHVVVVEATVIATHQPSYRCGTGAAYTAVNIDQVMTLRDGPSEPIVERPTASTACVLVVDSPSCTGTERLVDVNGSARIEYDEPSDIEVEVDGVTRRTRFVMGTWRACGLAGGRHEVRLCTGAGRLTCAVTIEASATTVFIIERVAPSVELRVDRVHRGAPSVGQTLTVGLAGYTEREHIELPAHATFAWRSDERASATQCEAPPSRPGCTRCDAGGSPPWLLAGIAALRLRRHRR